MAGKDTSQETPAVPARELTGSVDRHRAVLSREGEFWRIAFNDFSCALRHSKGLAYLGQLLRFPETEFHALDLVRGTSDAGGDPDGSWGAARSSLPRGGDALTSAGIHVGDLGDAGEMLDEQAKAEYRRRLAELREELAEAKGLGQVEPAERAENEIEAITAELSRAVGLGGRNRRAASASERARQSVTHAIKSALEKIAENHGQLGLLLSRSISTGTFCSYYPDPAIPVAWEFGPSAEHPPVAATTASVEQKTLDVRGSVSLRAPETVAILGRSRTEIVGREVELEQFWSAASRARKGDGKVVLVGGGPGVGKTRLALEFLARASQRGFANLTGRCYEREEPHPLMPFVEIIEGALAQASSKEQFRSVAAGNAPELAQIAPCLRRVFPDLTTPPELPTAQVRRYLFQSLFDFIARLSRTKPLLLLLDDLHWADESTLAMVTFLARRIEHVPVLVLGAYRDEKLDSTRPLNRTLEELLRLGINPVKLEGLPREGVAQMLTGLSHRQPPAHLVNLIFAETEGNPFFVEEVFRHLAEEGKIFDDAGEFLPSCDGDELTVPENVRLVLGRRLDRLSENAREVLSVASIIGRSFSFMLLEAVLDRSDPDALFDGLEEAQRMSFITSSTQGPETPFAFSHELVRQTLQAAISQPRQQRLHLKIAQAMEKVFGNRIEEHSAEVAYHLAKSGPYIDPARMVRYLSLTGQSLLRAGALEDARLTLAKALQYQQPDMAMRARTLADLAGAERGLGDWNAATSHLQEAIGLYTSAGDLRSVGRIVFEMVESLVWTGRFDAAAQIAEHGLNHLRRQDEGMYRCRLLAALGYIKFARGESDAAKQAFNEVLASPASSPFLARILAYRSVCSCNLLQLESALEDSRQSVALSDSQSSPWTHALALSIEMRSLYYLGKPEQALRIARELEPLARGVGQLAVLTNCVSIGAWAEFGREPDLTLLERRIRDDATFNRGASLSLFLAQSLGQMSLVKFLSGDWDDARSLAQEASTSELHHAFVGFGLSMLLRQAAYSGDREGVLELALQTHPRLPVIGKPATTGAWSLLMGTVESLYMVGENRKAAQLYPIVRELVASGVVCMALGCRFPETMAGVAAGAAGNWDTAEKHFQNALKQSIEMPHRVEEAEIKRFHASILLQRGVVSDRERAARMLREAAEAYERIGMWRHLELTRTLLRGIRKPPGSQ